MKSRASASIEMGTKSMKKAGGCFMGCCGNSCSVTVAGGDGHKVDSMAAMLNDTSIQQLMDQMVMWGGLPGMGGALGGGLKDFIIRGNVVDLCVAVVLGAAFTELIDSFVSSFVTPLIGIIGNPDDADSLVFVINGSTFTYGEFLNAAISFIIICLVVYFLVVMPLMKMLHQIRPTRTCPRCLAFDIPCEASVCKECGTEIPVVGKNGKPKSQEEDEDIFQDPMNVDLELGLNEA